LQLLSQTRQPCSRTCTAQPRRAAAAAHQPSTGAPCISTRSAVLARPISLKSKSVGTSASLSDRHRIRSKISLGFEAPSRQHITFAAGPSEIRCWLLLLDPPVIHTKKRGEGKEERGAAYRGEGSGGEARRRCAAEPPRRRPRLHAPSPSPREPSGRRRRRDGLDLEGVTYGLNPGRNGWEGGRTVPVSKPGRPKRTTIPAQDCFQTGLLYSGRIQASSGPIRSLPNEAHRFSRRAQCFEMWLM